MRIIKVSISALITIGLIFSITVGTSAHPFLRLANFWIPFMAPGKMLKPKKYLSKRWNSRD
jgi:hypothetical protein